MPLWPPDGGGGGGGLLAIGEEVVGGSPDAVLFLDALGLLAIDVPDFEYNKATHQLRLSNTAQLVFKPNNAASDASAALIHVQPTNDGTSTPSPWNLYQLRSLFGPTDWDHSMGFGWNFGPGHDATKGSCVILQEHNFDSSGTGAGPILDEMHWSMQAPGGTEVRAWTTTINWTTGVVNGSHVLDQLQTLDRLTGGVIFTLTKSKLELSSVAAGACILSQTINNVPAIQQRNSMGVAKELLMLDSADQGRLFRGQTDWYSNSSQAGAAQRAGIVNDASNATSNRAEWWLLPVGGTPGYSVAAVLSAYNNIGTNQTGLQLKTNSGAALNLVADFTKDGYVKLTSAAGNAATLIPYTGDPNGALTAVKGSLAFNAAGSGVANRLWVNTNGGTAWTAIVTVA